MQIWPSLVSSWYGEKAKHICENIGCFNRLGVADQYQILGLQIAVDDTLQMKVLDAENDFGRVESNTFMREHAVSLQVEEEFSAVDILHDEIQFLVGLEGVVQLNQEGVVELHEDALLRYGVHQLVFFDNPLFIELFHRVDLSSGFVFDLHHLTKTACELRM